MISPTGQTENFSKHGSCIRPSTAFRGPLLSDICFEKELGMELRDIMTKHVHVVSPSATIREAARLMRDLDTGILPVSDEQAIVGLVTDRDIVVRALADGKDADSAVTEAMTGDVVCLYEDDDVEDAAQVMEEKQIRRLIVLNRNQELAGIVSLADLTREVGDDELTGEVLKSVSDSPGASQPL
jgi:CBS domain-containing protein